MKLPPNFFTYESNKIELFVPHLAEDPVSKIFIGLLLKYPIERSNSS